MTEQEFDTMLRSALLEAQAKRWQPVTESGPELVWTRSRQRVMDRILADPFGYGKRAARPLWRRALGRVGQAAACLLLAGTLTYVAVPPARAWVHEAVQMVVEWLSTNTRFRFQGEARGELGRWRPTYLPEGYEEIDAFALGSGWSITYKNSANDQIVFDYTLIEAGNLYNFDNEHSDYSEIQLNEQPAHLFVSNTAGKPSYLVWLDEGGTISYFLMAYLPEGEFLAVAESIAAQ